MEGDELVRPDGGELLFSSFLQPYNNVRLQKHRKVIGSGQLLSCTFRVNMGRGAALGADDGCAEVNFEI